MKYNNEEEQELISMVCETNEDVQNKIYEICEPQIKYYIKKYLPSAIIVGVEPKDLEQEALLAFSDALNCYDEKKQASLKTFVSLCIERRLRKVIDKAQNQKNKINREVLSLDYDYKNTGLPLIEIIGDINSDPLIKFSEDEQLEQLETKIKLLLSKNETIVFEYLKKGMNYQEIAKILDKTPKQIDNTIQRIKQKVKMIIEGEKNERKN